MGDWALKRLLRKGYAKIWRFRRRIFDAPRGKFPIAHHGIQRSGTNYLLALLEQGNYRVVNKIDPRRNSPSHKHARWQLDKSTIVMSKEYLNDFHANDVESLNALCGYEAGMKHVVIMRSARSWIGAIFRWGQDNNWFPSADYFLSERLYEGYFEEWAAYYKFWIDMSLRHPERVCIVRFEDLKRCPDAEIARIDRLCGVSRASGLAIDGDVRKVPHSKPLTVKRSGVESDDMERFISGRILQLGEGFF